MPARIALVGDRDPEYLTHRELDASIALMPAGVEARWVATDGPDARRLDSFDALWIVPGTPYRDERAGVHGDRARPHVRRADPGHVRRLPAHARRVRPQRRRHARRRARRDGSRRRRARRLGARLQPGRGAADGDDRARARSSPSCAERRRSPAFTGAATASSRPISSAWSPRAWWSRRPPRTPVWRRSSCPATRFTWRRSSSRRSAARRAGTCIRSWRRSSSTPRAACPRG